MLPIGGIPHFILWLKESTTLYGFGLVLGGAFGVYSGMLSSDAGASLIGAGLPLLLPNHSPLYEIIKGKIPQFTNALSHKRLFKKDIKQEMTMTNENPTNTQNTANAAPNTEAATSNIISSDVATLSASIGKLIGNINGGNLSNKQSASLELLEKLLTFGGDELADALSKHYDMAPILEGLEKVTTGLEQIEEGYKDIKGGFSKKEAA